MIFCLRIIFFFLFSCCATNILLSQNSSTVSIISSGFGANKDEAQKKAIRSSIEQVIGVFVTSNTETINDIITKDEIISFSNGNVESYELLNETKFPDGSWSVVLKANISVSKLRKYIISKGASVEFNGDLFAINIQQDELTEKSEVELIYKLVGNIHEIMQTSFDYNIHVGTPKFIEKDKWELPLVVNAIANSNIEIVSNYLITTLTSISMNPSEVDKYGSYGKSIYKVIITYNGSDHYIYLRQKYSIDILNSFSYFSNFYHKLFVIFSGKDTLGATWVENANTVKTTVAHNETPDKYKPKTTIKDYLPSKTISSYTQKNNYISSNPNQVNVNIKIPILGEVISSFYYSDYRTVEQIKKMTNYSVKNLGVVSRFKYGGIVINDNQNKGIVLSLFSPGQMLWNEADSICKGLDLAGYSDWKLPSSKDLSSILNNKFSNHVNILFVPICYLNTSLKDNYQTDNKMIWTESICDKQSEEMSINYYMYRDAVNYKNEINCNKIYNKHTVLPIRYLN
jgi:hypothetical protein